MKKFWAQPFKYGLTFNIIEKTSIGFFFFVTFTVLLTCIFLLHPTLLDDDSDITTNNIYIIYVFINIVGNYLLAVRSDSSYKTGVMMHEPPKTWYYCQHCNQHSPPRAHHCSLCNACVLKQDHHCFFISKCVGLKNQRYFIPYLLYVFLGSFHSMRLVFQYLNLFYIPFTFSFYGLFSYLFFGAFYNWLFTDVTVGWGNMAMVLLLYTNVVLCTGTICFFCAQMFLVARGQSPNEFAKGIRNSDLGIVKNIRSVFGRFFFLYFFVPLPIKFEEKKLSFHNYI